MAYPIHDDIPHLLPDEAIPLEGADANGNTTIRRYWDDSARASQYLMTNSTVRKYMDLSEVEEPLYWLDPKPGELVLDVGCGSGRQLIEISKKTTVIGLDRSVTMIKRAREKANAENSFFVIGDCLYQPFQDGTFDKLLSVRVIQHLDDDEKQQTLNECNRVCTEGGQVIVVTYKTGTPHHWLIRMSCSPFRHLLNALIWILTAPLSVPLRLLGIGINPFPRVFAWSHPEISQFSSPRRLGQQFATARFKKIRLYPFQVGDVFLLGRFLRIDSVLEKAIPVFLRRYYQWSLETDRRYREGETVIGRFLFKDKIIAVGEKPFKEY